MISISSYLWSERRGKCPSCQHSIMITASKCPVCGHQLSQAEIEVLKEESNKQFKRSAVIGFFVFLLFIILVVYFVEG